MDTDPYIANWVLEYLLRQSLENHTLKFLVHALPLPNHNLNLKKLFLLKKLDSDISRNSVSETILDLLDQLEQIEFQSGNENVSDTMRRAYCAAAVECTLKNLKGGGCEDKDKRFKFFEAVRRVWKGKVERMKKVVEKGGLGSEALWAWKREIEEAVFDDVVCDSVVKKSEGVNGVEAVNAYIREEKLKMGPSFLEVVADRVKTDKILQRILGVDGIEQVPVKENGDAGGSNASKEMKKACSNGLASGSPRSVNIVDPNETTAGPSHKVASNAEVDKAREALQHPPEDNHASAAEVSQAPGGSMSNEPRPCLMELNNTAHTREQDESIDGYQEGKSMNLKKRKALRRSLLEEDTLQVAGKENGVSGVSNASKEMNKGLSRGLTSGNPRGVNIVDPNETTTGPSYKVAGSAEVDKAGEALQHPPEDNHASAAGVAQAPNGNMCNEPRPSLMERKNTAHTFEWDDSIDGSPGKSLNLKKRRKARRWSVLEEDTLRAAVEEHGKGNWKEILRHNRDTFEGRTEVDLKDKWRNMTRS